MLRCTVRPRSHACETSARCGTAEARANRLRQMLYRLSQKKKKTGSLKTPLQAFFPKKHSSTQ